MITSVVDTNVLLVANESPPGGPKGLTPQASATCVLAAVSKLLAISTNGRLGLDLSGLVLKEYRDAGASHSGQPGFGDAFFKWAHQNQANPEHCDVAELHRLNGSDDFAEFPADPDLAGFDRSDRKFVAICVALGPSATEVVNCVDSDWANFRKPLERNGIQIAFLCSDTNGE